MITSPWPASVLGCQPLRPKLPVPEAPSKPQQSGGSADRFQWSSTAGVAGAGPGRVDALGAGDHTDAVCYNTGVPWSTGTPYEDSIFFLQCAVTDGQIYQAVSGFLRGAGSNFAGGSSAVWGQLRDPGSGEPFLRLFVQNTQAGSNSATFSLSANTWYEGATRMTLSSATLGHIGVYLYSRGSDGTAARSLVQSIELTGQTITPTGGSTKRDSGALSAEATILVTKLFLSTILPCSPNLPPSRSSRAGSPGWPSSAVAAVDQRLTHPQSSGLVANLQAGRVAAPGPLRFRP